MVTLIRGVVLNHKTLNGECPNATIDFQHYLSLNLEVELLCYGGNYVWYDATQKFPRNRINVGIGIPVVIARLEDSPIKIRYRCVSFGQQITPLFLFGFLLKKMSTRKV